MVAKVTQPSAIASQEQAVMHAIMALDIAAPNQAVLERPNLTSFNVEWQLIKSPDGTEVFIGRVVLPVASIDTLEPGAKLWLAAKPIPGAAAIPAYYGTN